MRRGGWYGGLGPRRRRHPIAVHGVYLCAFDLAVKRSRGRAGRATLPPAPPSRHHGLPPARPPSPVVGRRDPRRRHVTMVYHPRDRRRPW